RSEVKALGEHKNAGYKIAAAARYAVGHVMTAVAGIGIRAGNAVPRACSHQRLRRIGKCSSVAFGLWPPRAFLVSPVGHEEFFAVLKQVFERQRKFLVIGQVSGYRDLLTNVCSA